MMEKIMDQLCLNREDEFGTENLYEESCHLIKVYITLSMDDAAYRSVILKVIKMNDDQCKKKIQNDLIVFFDKGPKEMGKEKEFQLFRKAILNTQKDYL